MNNYESYLEHHGIKGMHWGDRRYQNSDGSLTPAGRARYGVGPARKALNGAIKKAKKGVKYVKTTAKDAAKKVKTASDEHAAKSLSKAISKGNVKNILKYVDRLNENQLNEALRRAKTVSELSNLQKPKEKVTKKISDIANAIGDVGSAASKITTARKNALEYRKSREEYNDNQAKKAEEANKKWREEHAARADSAKENLKGAFASAKDRNEKIKKTLEGMVDPGTPKGKKGTERVRGEYAGNVYDDFFDSLRKASRSKDYTYDINDGVYDIVKRRKKRQQLLIG